MKQIKKIINNKIVRGTAKVLEYAFFACMILYIGFISIQKVSNNSSILGYRMFTVVSESMKPVYKIGDILVVKETSLTNLKVGDDVTYYGTTGDMKDRIITHRIINITGNQLITKGTANVLEDPQITYDQIYGKVVKKMFLLTTISNIVRNQYGFFFLVFAPLVIIIFVELVDAIKDIKNGKKNEK